MSTLPKPLERDSAPVAEVRSDAFPPGIPWIVANEGAERFSFYGMRAILKLQMIALFLKYVDESTVPEAVRRSAIADSTEVVHLFNAGVYAFPLIGAVLSDRLLGKYRTILWVSLIYCLGHAVLFFMGRFGVIGMFDAALYSMYLGLFLIAVGSGGIKPCVSANVGDQFSAKNGHMVGKVFQIFYFIINFGSFLSTVLTPFLFKWKAIAPHNAEVAFGVPGILMLIATVFFWLGRKKFIRVPPKPGGKLGLLDTVVTTLLFSPLFALIFGYFVVWESFVGRAEAAWSQENAATIAAAAAAGTPMEFSKLAQMGSFFAQYWWLPALALGAVVAGFALFNARQRIQADRTSFLPVLIHAFRNRKARRPGEGFFDPARRELGEEAGDGPPAVLKIMVVFSMVSVFWALFDQHSSTFIDQAKRMALGFSVPAYLGVWGLLATFVLVVFAGVWLFSWISNRPLRRATVLAMLGFVAGAGLVAGVLDVVGPPRGNKVLPVVVRADTRESVILVREGLKGVKEDGVAILVVDGSYGAVTDKDARRAAKQGAKLLVLGSAIEDPAREVAAANGVDLRTYLTHTALVEDVQRMRDHLAEGPTPRMIRVEMGAGQLSALNPLMVMFIIPLLNILVYAPLRKYRGIEVRPLQKMVVGMFLASVSFAAVAVLQIVIERAGDGVVHGLWQSVPYFVLTTAEVLVSITGLEFAYTQAPRAMKSTIMGFWLLCVTLGNLLVAFLAPLQKALELSQFFWVFAGLMGAAAMVFSVLAWLYKGKTYLQHA